MLKCIAIDDEPIALNIIESYCQQHGEIQLETFTSPQEGMNRIKEISPDIVFMDIEMTGYSGIELAKELPADSALIFTTAYANYALEGFAQTLLLRALLQSHSEGRAVAEDAQPA